MFKFSNLPKKIVGRNHLFRKEKNPEGKIRIEKRELLPHLPHFVEQFAFLFCSQRAMAA